MRDKPLLTRQQNGNPHAQTRSVVRDRTPRRCPGSSSCPGSPCPYAHDNPNGAQEGQNVENAESPIQCDRPHTGSGQPSSGSDGPPSGGPPGIPITAMPQHFDIASNPGAPQDSDSDSSTESAKSEDNVPYCTPWLERVVRDAIGQRFEQLESKNVVVAHMSPPKSELRRDNYTDWSWYTRPVILMIIRGLFWTRSNQIAFTRQELRMMTIPQMDPILERYGIPKTPHRKEQIIERIIEELIENHDPWLLRSQQRWRSCEPTFWPKGHAPRQDDLVGPFVPGGLPYVPCPSGSPPLV